MTDEAGPKPAPRRRRVLRTLGLAALAAGGLLGYASTPYGDFLWSLFAPTEIRRDTPDDGRADAPRHRMVLVSIDGLGQWLVDTLAPPTLTRLAREGTVAELAETPRVSTVPSHAVMISGRGDLPIRWGYRPWRRFRARTIFTECGEHGLRCGLFATKRKMAELVEHEPGAERYAYAGSDTDALEEALAYIRERDPDFVFVHLASVDVEGHRFGWGDEEQREALATIDAALGAFVEGLRTVHPERPLTLLVTADHGGQGYEHDGVIPEIRQVPWILWGDGVPAGRLDRRVSTADVAPSVLALLGIEPPADWTSRARVPPWSERPAARSPAANGPG